ncbi:MAG TPA: creatininase, partial [Propionibacteriaceae bacterium]|nr:creatininase [Propionibacteriaceae bacterium]
DFKIVTLDAWWNVMSNLVPAGFFEVWNGLGHGGEGETSMCLALFPDLVDVSKAAGVVPTLPPYVDVKWTFDELTNTGASGDPTKATLEKGRKMKEALVDAIVKVLGDLEKNGWDYRSAEVK